MKRRSIETFNLTKYATLALVVLAAGVCLFALNAKKNYELWIEIPLVILAGALIILAILLFFGLIAYEIQRRRERKNQSP